LVDFSSQVARKKRKLIPIGCWNNQKGGLNIKKAIILVTLLFLPMGCVNPTGEFEAVYDHFYDYTKSRMAGNVLAGTPPLSVTYVELNAEEYRSRAGKILYSLTIDYSPDEWLFIKQEESLILEVNEEPFGFKGRGSSAHRGIMPAGRVREKAWYGINL